MADFVFKLSPNIVLGSYASSRVGQFAKEWGTRFMLLVDPVLTEFGITEKITSALQERSIDFFVYDEIPPAPDANIVQQVFTLGREAHIHGIISVGGTKINNIARSAAALFHELHDVYDYIEGTAPTTGALPVISVPTTLCDPFIFSDKTPIIDGRSRQVKMLKIQPGLCRLAIFDPTLTVSFTEIQRTSMILHALCIAVEAYTSQRANFFSDSLIEKALELLSTVINDTETETSTSSQELLSLQASSMISLAAASSSIGVGSGISLSINARQKISRSLTSAILLPHIVEEVSKYKTDKIAKIARLLNIVPPEGASNEDAIAILSETIRNKIAVTNLPARLKDLSISMEQLALVAENTEQLAGMYAFSRSMSSDDVFAIMKNAY